MDNFGLVEYLQNLQSKLGGEFIAKPYYDKETDSIILYARATPSHFLYVNQYLTVFLAIEDDSVMGFDITHAYFLSQLLNNLCGELKEIDIFSLIKLTLIVDEKKLSLDQLFQLGNIASGHTVTFEAI